MKQESPSLEGDDSHRDVSYADTYSEYTPSQDEARQGRSKSDMSAIGAFMGTIEILSSDQSSDDRLRASLKQSRGRKHKQSTTKIRKCNSRGRPTGNQARSPTMSRESNHFLNYSYKEDARSLGGRSSGPETSFQKLRWPVDEAHVIEGLNLKTNGHNSVPHINESHNQSELHKGDEEICVDEGDESNEDHLEGNAAETKSDGEELPVLPKVPVKRKLVNEAKGGERRTQRGRPKSASPQMKKQRTPQIDASVITKLEFGARPQNCVSIAALFLSHYNIGNTMHVVHIAWDLCASSPTSH